MEANPVRPATIDPDSTDAAAVEVVVANVPFTGVRLGASLTLSILLGGQGLSMRLTPEVARALANGLVKQAGTLEKADAPQFISNHPIGHA